MKIKCSPKKKKKKKKKKKDKSKRTQKVEKKKDEAIDRLINENRMRDGGQRTQN